MIHNQEMRFPKYFDSFPEELQHKVLDLVWDNCKMEYIAIQAMHHYKSLMYDFITTYEEFVDEHGDEFMTPAYAYSGSLNFPWGFTTEIESDIDHDPDGYPSGYETESESDSDSDFD